MPDLRKLVDDVVLTDAAGAAAEIARASKEYDGIVVVGGDGTILEVIGDMQRNRQYLAAIPTGRGNCLARDLGIKTIADGLLALQGGDDTCIDLMQADISFNDDSEAKYLSASTIALGYVVSVVDRASNYRGAGPYGYALATLLTPPNLFSCRIGVGESNDDNRTCTGIIINNTVNLANFPAFKDAKLRDGLMDLLILQAGWFGQTLHNLSVLSGLGFHDAGDHSQTRNVRVSLDSQQTLMIDGELLPNVVGLSVDCIPEALRCRTIMQQ